MTGASGAECWSDLVAAAQVGTRKSVPVRATDLLPEGGDGERTALLELGAVGLMRRAGAVGVAARPLPPAPPEIRRIADAADALEEALDDAMPAAVQWAREAARRGFVAPPAVVSRLVPLVARHPEFGPVLGERGRWLAPIMGVVLEDPDDVAGDPLTLEAWEALTPKERVRRIERGPDDGDLLSRALGDRRKEVREAAAERIILVADAPPTQELREMARAAVRVERGFLRSRMAVTPPAPESLPKWLAPIPAPSGIGPVALALFHLVANVPPGIWGEPPERMLDLVKGTEHASVLTFAWQSAAARFEDPAWLDALLSGTELTGPFSGIGVIQRASDEAFERHMGERLRTEGNDARGAGLAGIATNLVLRDRPIGPALSRAFVEAAARQGRRQDKAGSTDSYSLRYRLTPAGGVLDPSALPLVDAGLGETLAPVQASWSRLLSLRARLLRSLE